MTEESQLVESSEDARDEVRTEGLGEELMSPRTKRNIIVHTIPLLCLGFIASVLDRVNFGNAHLALVGPGGPGNATGNATAGFGPILSELEYGYAGSAFSIGYILFEIPSNMLLKRTSARLHFARICLLWGVTSLCMMFVTNGTGAILCRFFLGVAEAGYFPGVVYYLSSWFTPQDRAQILALFYIGIPIAGFIGGLLGYGLLLMEGLAGLRGWQWLFLLEAIPSIILSAFFWFFLPERPDSAAFLTLHERLQVATLLEPYRDDTKDLPCQEVASAFSNPTIWAIGFAYLTINIPRDILGLFTPSIINQFGVDSVLSNLLTAPMYVTNLVLMLLIARWASRTKFTFLMIVWPLTLSVGSWMALALELYYEDVVPLGVKYFTLLVILSTASAFVAVFWSWVTLVLGNAMESGGTLVVVAIGIINSVGNTSGLISPVMSSAIKDATGSYIWVAAAAALSGTLAILLLTSVYIIRRTKARQGETRI
eukprot:TRINITY_DN23357_c0_g1_i1.p1 TRINITY_DN23357_c0_g1~~TRINITY_DN23357_c0_g1_i1.p1  ORF type:complete len:494 (-),score=49.12 TRINITY_DN23357_c0_g1_i1:2-1450(-)